MLVGSGTALRDNPALTTRIVRGRTPDRFVLDSRLRVPATARVWKTTAPAGWRWPPSAPGAPAGAPGPGGGGVDGGAGPAGRVSLPAFAARLGEEGYTNALVEGGGTLAGSLLGAPLVDVVWMVMARNLLLGGGGPGWTQGLEVSGGGPGAQDLPHRPAPPRAGLALHPGPRGGPVVGPGVRSVGAPRRQKPHV